MHLLSGTFQYVPGLEFPRLEDQSLKPQFVNKIMDRLFMRYVRNAYAWEMKDTVIDYGPNLTVERLAPDETFMRDIEFRLGIREEQIREVFRSNIHIPNERRIQIGSDAMFREYDVLDYVFRQYYLDRYEYGIDDSVPDERLKSFSQFIHAKTQMEKPEALSDDCLNMYLNLYEVLVLKEFGTYSGPQLAIVSKSGST